MTYSREEQETIIRWDETGEPAEIYTCSTLVIERMRKAGIEPYRQEGEGRFYRVSPKAVQVRPYGAKRCWIGGRGRAEVESGA